MRNFLAERLGWAATAVLTAAAAAMAALFVHALVAYRAYYYLTAGPGMALELFLVPASFFLALGCAAMVARALLRRTRMPMAVGLGLGITASALLLGALLAAEVVRTTPARRAEGGADLHPFLTYHFAGPR